MRTPILGQIASLLGLGRLVQGPGPGQVDLDLGVGLLVLRRAQDMVEVVIRFGGAKLESGPGGARLARVVSSRPLLLTAWLRPQHGAERAYPDEAPIAGPVEARLSGWSRLVLTQPGGSVEPMELSAETLLRALSDWPLKLSPNASPEGPGDDSPGAKPPTLAAAAAFKDGPHKLVGKVESTAYLAGVSAVRKLGARGGPADLASARRKAALGGARQLQVSTPEVVAAVSAAFDKGVAAAGAPMFVSGPGAPQEPALNETALELPSRLILSPTSGERFRHRLHAFAAAGGRTELWHTRLTRKASGRPGGEAEASRDPASVRPIWSPDHDPEPLSLSVNHLFGLVKDDAGPFAGVFHFAADDAAMWPMMPEERSDLVRLGADYAAKREGTGEAWTPLPAKARRLELSALGGFLDVDGRWPEPLPKDLKASVTAWRQRLSLGRDSHVEVVSAGVLAPFGHRAVRVTVTEREVRDTPPNLTGGEWTGKPGAFLIKRQFIAVLEPVKVYAPEQFVDAGRTFPFSEVELLDGPRETLISAAAAYWPRLAGSGEEMRFDVRAVDHAGRTVRFRLPLMFVRADAASDEAGWATLAQVYGFKPDDARFTASTGGQIVRLAPDPGRDSLSFAAHALTFGMVKFTQSNKGGIHRFRPVLALSRVEAPGSAEFLGKPALVEATFADPYVKDGFGGANKGEVALRLKTPLPLFAPASGTSADRVGPVAAPQTAIQGFSRLTGAVTGPASGGTALQELAAGELKPASLLPEMKLLGAFDLKDLLADFILPDAEPPTLAAQAEADAKAKGLPAPAPPPEVKLGEALRLKRERLPDGGQVAVLTFNQALKGFDFKGLVFEPRSGGARLLMDARAATPAGGGAPWQSVDARVENFAVGFFGAVRINFDRLAFISKPGSKPDFDLVLDKDALAFEGDLAFLQRLADILPPAAFSDPPDIQITASGVVAGYSLGLPPLQLGALALSNISFGARFELPFLGGSPSLRVNFAERHSPFSILVALLGGGGFVAVELNTCGLKSIEGTLEAQAGIAINLGVAAGAVTARLGVYYRWVVQPASGSMTLEAFAELRGELCVLGLISVSITFHVGLKFIAEGDQKLLAGVATITVEIELLFFSKAVSVSCERRFVGCDGDPTFAEVMTPPAWLSYASAFE